MDAKTEQTAVDWLVYQLQKHHIKIDIKNTVAFEQAKAIEKQQLKKAYFFGWKTRERKPPNTCAKFEDYSERYLKDIYGIWATS